MERNDIQDLYDRTSEEVPGAFKKSSFSGGGNCVEVAMGQDSVRVRDSKNREGGVLTFTRDEWRAFLQGVGNNEFDITER